MMNNTNVLVLHTRVYKKETVEDFQKEKQSGVIYLKCPETQEEIPHRWNGKCELNRIRKNHKENINKYKLRMVSQEEKVSGFP